MFKKIIDALFALFNTQQRKNIEVFLGDLEHRENTREKQAATITKLRAGLAALDARMRAVQDMIQNPF